MYLDVVHEGEVRAVRLKVLIVGMGGLGCPASLALARRGVSSLTMLDPDLVEASNLHRQPWHHLADVGSPKVHSAATKLKRAFPLVEVVGIQGRLDAQNAAAHFNAHDVVVDATDGTHTKFLLSDASVLTGIPLIYGGVLRFEGLAMRIEQGGPCLRCLFETPPTENVSCAQAGVLGSMAGLVGSLQASLVLAPLKQLGEAPLHVLDGRHLGFRVVRVRRRQDCAACGEGVKPVLLSQG